jgi:hypothetical protein
MKTLSIRQPYASLICRGIKKVENRSWETKYRGKLLIHASGKPLAWPELSYFTRHFLKDYQKYYGSTSKGMPFYYSAYMTWIKELYHFYHLGNETSYIPPLDKIKKAAKIYGYAMSTQTIIGETELVDIIRNSKDVFAEPGCFHWVLENPVLYDKPIMDVMGKLQLWEYKI